MAKRTANAGPNCTLGPESKALGGVGEITLAAELES